MQETRVNAIQYDNTAAQIFSKMGDTSTTDGVAKARLEWEKEKYRQELKTKELEKESEFQKSVFKQIDDAHLADEIMASKIQSLKDIAAQQKNPLEKQKELSDALLTIKTDSEAFKAPFAMLKSYYEGMTAEDKKGFDLGRAQEEIRRQLAVVDSKGNVTGYKSAKDIGDPAKIVNEIFNGQEAFKFWTPSAGREAVDKDLKAMDPSKISVSVRDQNGKVRTGEKTEVEFKPLIQQWNDKTGKVEMKTGALGFINDEAWNKYKDDKQVEAWLNREAFGIMNQYNNHTAAERRDILTKNNITDIAANSTLPANIAPNSESYENLKKAILTNYIKNYTNEINKSAESKTIVTQVTTGGDNAPRYPVRDYFVKVEDLVDSRKRGMKAAVSDLPSNLINLVVDAANATGGTKKRGKNAPYTSADISLGRNANGEIAIFDASSGTQVTSLDPDTFNADANSFLTNKAGRAGYLKR